MNRRFRAKLSNRFALKYTKIRDFRPQSFAPVLRPLLGIKSRILKWTLMKPKILLEMG